MSYILGNTELTFNGKVDYSIGALLEDDNSYTMPWLEFSNNKGLNNEEFLDRWDNETYLVKELHNKIIKPWVENKKVTLPKEFTQLLAEEQIYIEDFQGLYDLFNRAFKLKMLKNE